MFQLHACPAPKSIQCAQDVARQTVFSFAACDPEEVMKGQDLHGNKETRFLFYIKLLV